MVAGIRRRIFASATPTFVGGENYGTIVVDALAGLVAEKREVHASILGFLPMEFLRNMGENFRDNRWVARNTEDRREYYSLQREMVAGIRSRIFAGATSTFVGGTIMEQPLS